MVTSVLPLLSSPSGVADRPRLLRNGVVMTVPEHGTKSSARSVGVGVGICESQFRERT